MQTLPLTRDLVLIGGGHTHALVLKRWGMKPLAGVRVTVINPGAVAAYSGMLPGFVAGHYDREALELDLVRLARFAGARAVLSAATGLDRARRLVLFEDRPPLRYDVASIDIGITSAMPDLAGFTEHGIAAKPLDRFATLWDHFRTEARAGRVAPQAVVTGGGVAGAEIAMAMAHALRGVTGATVTLADRSDILAEMRPATSRALHAALADAGVRLRPHSPVERLHADRVEFADGSALPSQFTLGAAGARPYDWLAQTGLELQNGFVSVGPTLQSSDPAIFAAGDCAHLCHAPRPKAGVFAVREAPVLFDNLRTLLSEGGEPAGLTQYHPQKDYLKLISLGGKAALADKNGIRLSGPLMWRWKDSIDRKFMSKLKDLAPMPAPALPEVAALGLRAEVAGKKPLCGGCGAKVGGDVLARALGERARFDRADVEAVAGDDAAVLVHGATRQVISTDHLRAFVDDPVTLARVAAVHALGDVWAMGAAPQSALATLTLPRLSEPLQEGFLAEITTAARAVFEAEGAALIGGHTSMGAEMSVGFTVTGLCDRPITLKGAQAGDALVLTKPVGTGVVMAGEMAMAANGRDVARCYTSMMTPSGAASRALPHARAMTDVTGFGLAGHLAAICRASGTGAVVDLTQVPVLPGALALAGSGIRSTIFDANRAAVPEADGPIGALFDLMFDPQTGGGLLATVPAETLAATLASLEDGGVGAAVIGTLTDDPTRLVFQG